MGSPSHIQFENLPIDVPGVDLPLEDGRTMIFRCEHCGDRTRVTLPLPIAEFLSQTREYLDGHHHCPEPKEPTDG